MPGTLLASDWQQSVEDNLRQAADDAIARARASATATIAPVQQAVQQVAPDPQAVAAQLHAYVDQIQPAAQQLGQNVAGAATTVLGGAQDAASDVADQLHQHVNNLVANGGGQPSVQALGGPPTPGETPTNNQGVVTSLGGTQPAPPNTADVSGPVGGAPSSDTTQSGMGAIDASSPSAFARSFAPYAQYAAQKLGIDPTWVAAMAASESNYGKADAAGHELFGVKALPGQPGTTLATHEGENGGTNMDQTFAAYDSPLDSVNAWIDLIKNHYKGAVGAPDLQTFVHGLKSGGYFTAGEGEYLGIVKGIASNIGNDVQAGLQAAGMGKPSVATTPPVTTAQARAADLGYTDISQFGDKQLTQAEAYAACGPAAAVRFAEKFGRNPTLREATDLASSVGWTTANGMAGISSQKALMDKLGVPTHIVQGPQWDAFAAEAQTGNPVTISTSGKNGGHYFFADGYNPDTGAFHVGQSGKDLKGGSEWMTPDQMQSLMGQAQGALFADNPASPVQSSAAGNKPTPLGGDSSAVSQPATVNGQTPRSATPIVMGGLQDAAGNVLGGAASAVGGALDSTARGAQDVLASTSRDVTNALGVIQQTAADIAPNLGGNDQELARRRAALEQNPAVLGGVGGEASTGPPGEQTPQTVLGGVARAATGIGMPPTDQVQSPAEIMPVQKETTEPITTANPLNRVVLPGQTAPVPVIGGLSNMLIEQAFANPLVFVPGAPLGEALNSVGKQVLEEVAPDAPALLARFGTGAINGLLQNGIIAAGDKDATPQSVGEAMAQGAVGGALIEGVPGGALKLGQAIVRHLPDLQPILERAAGSARTLATDESGALKLSPSAPEPVPTPTEPRTPITEGTSVQRELPGMPAGADTAVRAQQGVDNPVDLRQSQRVGRLVNTLGEDIGPNDMVTVYHATTPEVAASLVENGFQPGAKQARNVTTIQSPAVARSLGKNVGDPLDYEPGRGQGQGVYFTTDPRAARDVYGSAIVAIDVPRSALEVPPERQTPRMTPERSLLLGDGYTTQPISPDQVRLVNTGGVPLERPAPPTPRGAAAEPIRTLPGGSDTSVRAGRPAEAEATGWRTYNSAFSGKPDEFRPHPDDINVTPSTPGAVFRGLTADEAASIQSRGVVKSTGAYSHPSEGTSFAPDFATAESTINYGRDNPSRTGRPTYVIEVSDGPDLAVDRRDGWPKAQAPISAGRITRVWQFEPDGTSRVGTTSLLERPSSPAPAPAAQAEPAGFAAPQTPAADVRGASEVPGVGGGTPPPETGFRAPVTPDDLNVRPVSQAEARQLVGPAYDPSTRTTQRPPGEGESPRRLEDVESNPHLLREPAEGETPMTADERQAHQDNLVDRFGTNQQRLDAIEEQLANPKAKPERPPWAAGFTNDQVATMAAKVGRSPFEPLWWEKAGLESGSGEVREMLNESGINRGDLNASREPTPAELRREQRELQQDQRHIEAAGDQLATAPVNARFAKPPDRNAAPLPFEHTTADPGADLAQQVVLKKGTLTSDPNEVTATNAAGVTGRGILNPAEVVHEPPSAETKALMPNLSAIGKDMPETAAQIQKSVEDNPQLWEHYRQGTISFDSLKNDLARRVGMTKEDWLKTKVGQAFNDREMVALQAAMIEEEARQTDLAKSIMAKGGVDALSPEELAYSMASLTEAQSLAAVAKGAGSTSGRALNARKVSFTRQLASDITAANERRAAQRTKAQATRVATRADDLLQNAKTLDQQKAVATAAASRPGQAGAPRAPKSIIDQIAQAYDELDRYNALSLHEKEGVFNKLQEQRAAQAAARAARVRGAPEELLAQLRKELQWEQNNFAKRKDTWETMAFQDSKAAENAAATRAGFRGGLYIEQQRKVANNALDAAQKETERAFDAELKRRGQQSNKAQKLLESMGGQEVTKDVLKNYLAALNDPDPGRGCEVPAGDRQHVELEAGDRRASGGAGVFADHDDG